VCRKHCFKDLCARLKARCAPACCEEVACCGAAVAAPAAAPIPAPPAPKK
jgi:hypothetical protein